MAEIDLKVKGRSVFEYEADNIPRIGEWVDISCDETPDELQGLFKVSKVTHRVFREKKSRRILSYATVEAE